MTKIKEDVVEKTLVDVVEADLSVANIVSVSANPMNVRKSIFRNDEVQE